MRLHQLKEGYSILPKMDREKYQERDGLEGPIMTRSGKVVYYDPKQGSYYDPDTDMYISYDDWKKLDSENMHKIDMDYDESVEDCDCECGEEPCKKCGKTHHENVQESEDKPYVCVHAKKGKHECHAKSSYEAAKKAAAHWKMKSTAGIDAHLAVDEGFTDIVKSVGNTFKRGFKSLTNRNNRPAKTPQPNQYTARVKPGRNTNYSGTSIAQKINWGGKFESADSSAMDKALRSIEKTFGGERKAINDQVTAMCRAADMLGSERFKDRAFSVVEQYGIDSKQELVQELHMMIKNEAEIDDEEIYGADTNIKMMKNAITKLRKADESLGEETIKYEDEYDTPVVIEIDKDKFIYNGNPITNYDWNNSAKAILTPGMHQKAKSWEEVHQYLSRFLGNPAGLQSACRQVFDMNDEGCKVNEAVMVSEAQFDEAAGEKDACYHKVKSRYKVWPSAYASGALVKCRKVGAANWGKSKK